MKNKLQKLAVLFFSTAIIITLCSCGAIHTADNSADGMSAALNSNENSDSSVKNDETENMGYIEELYKYNFPEMTVDESGILDNIQKSYSNGSFTYVCGPEPVEGTKYAYIRGSLKCLTKSKISLPEIYGNVVVDGYEYELESLNLVGPDSSYTNDLAPLTTYTYMLYAKLPDEIVDNCQSCIMNIGFENEFENNYSFDDLSELEYNYVYQIK